MKKIKRLLSIFLVLTTLLTGCSYIGKNYDATIIKHASKFTSGLGYDDNSLMDSSDYLEVTKNSDYKFTVNGTEIPISVNSQSEEFVPTNIQPVSTKYDKIISKSKKLVYRYIDASKILKDKDGIKKYIDTLQTKEAYFTDDACVGAYFSHTDGVLYINTNSTAYICEWMIVHEIVHAMCYYTHNFSIEDEEYAFNLFNEVMTDIITSSLNPNIPDNIISGYSIYYFLLYPYINLFKEEAIKAYFYGYDIIYEKIDHDEFEFFVLVIENYDLVEDSTIYYDKLISKWYANK